MFLDLNRTNYKRSFFEPVEWVPERSAAVAATAVNSDVETSSHQLNKQQSSCAAVLTTTSTSTDISTKQQLASLRAEVHQQQTTIATLQTQLSLVLLLLGIMEPVNHKDNSSGAPTNVDNHATEDQQLWSTIAANTKTQNVELISSSRWLPPSTKIRLKADDVSQV